MEDALVMTGGIIGAITQVFDLEVLNFGFTFKEFYTTIFVLFVFVHLLRFFFDIPVAGDKCCNKRNVRISQERKNDKL